MANEATPEEIEEVTKKAKDKLDILNPTPRDLFPDELSLATDLYVKTITEGYSKVIIKRDNNIVRISCVILKNQNGDRFSASWSQSSESDHGITLSITELDVKDPKIIQFEQQLITDKVKVRFWNDKIAVSESKKRDFMNQVSKATVDLDSTALFKAREERTASHTILKGATVIVDSANKLNFPGLHPLKVLASKPPF